MTQWHSVMKGQSYLNNVVIPCTGTCKIDRQCMYKRYNEARSCNQCCRGKAISITYSECVSVALFIQHAKCVYHILLSYVASQAAP
jgi:hypothetical protein